MSDKITKNATAAKLLMSWGSMASVQKMQATSHDIQPTTPSSKGR